MQNIISMIHVVDLSIVHQEGGNEYIPILGNPSYYSANLSSVYT